MKTTTLILAIAVLASCQPEPHENAQIAQRLNQAGIAYTTDDVAQLRGGGSEPCLSDYNTDGVINGADLGIVLSGYGTTYDISHINHLLSVYGNTYTIDIIPAWNNYIQDFACSLGWEIYLRRQCAGNVSNFPDATYTVEWLHDGEVISYNNEQLDFQNYEVTGAPIKECSGWQPPCNGINEVTLRVFHQGNTFERTAEGWVYTDDYFGAAPDCGTGVQAPNLFGNSFEPYEFCLTCE